MKHVFIEEQKDFAHWLGTKRDTKALEVNAIPRSALPGGNKNGHILNVLGTIALYELMGEDWKLIPNIPYRSWKKDFITLFGRTWTVRTSSTWGDLIIPVDHLLTDNYVLFHNVSYDSATLAGWANKDLVQSERPSPGYDYGLFYSLQPVQLYQELPK